MAEKYQTMWVVQKRKSQYPQEVAPHIIEALPVDLTAYTFLSRFLACYTSDSWPLHEAILRAEVDKRAEEVAQKRIIKWLTGNRVIDMVYTDAILLEYYTPEFINAWFKGLITD